MIHNSKLHSAFCNLHSALNFKKRSASALILTLVLVGLVASLAFFVARSSVRETKNTASGSASIAAYYAAEAGIEDGLARVAADRNLEVPTCKFGFAKDSACNSTDDSNFNAELSVEDIALAQPKSWPQRVRMARFGANGALKNNDPNVTGGDADLNKVIDALVNNADATKGISVPAVNEYIYDLKITSKTKKPNANTPSDPGADTTNLINKSGDFKEFTFDTQGANVPDAMNIYWKCEAADCSPDVKLIIEYTLYDPATCFPDVDASCVYKVERSEPGETRNSNLPLSLFGATSPRVYKVKIKAVSSDPNNANFPGVNFGAVATKSGVAIAMKSDIVKIQSIGYFGGIKRRLEAEVDKTSGSLLGLFDYAVYTGGTFTQPN
jgi:Tfp pilus assembly protein PilX